MFMAKISIVYFICQKKNYFSEISEFSFYNYIFFLFNWGVNFERFTEWTV